MEKAAVYCFAELERAKGGGVILKKPEEKVVFLAEFCYPLWLTPWGDLTLIFDGLKTTAHTLTYKIIPDIRAFMENMQRSSKSLATYMNFLSHNINYFQLLSEKAVVIDALITELNLLNELSTFLSDARQIKTSSSEIVFLSPTIEESAISTFVQELETLKLEFMEDVKILYDSMKLLNKTTRNFVKIIRGNIQTIKEEFTAEIKKQESIIKPKVNHISEEYDEQITKLTKKFKKQILPLQKEKLRLEKTRDHLLNKIDHCNEEAKTCATNKDAVGEREWKEKANEARKEISEIEARMRGLEEKIKKMEENELLETFRIRSELETKVKEAKKDLLELEASRDAKIHLQQQEIEKLENLTSRIIHKIDSMAKLREAEIANFEKLGVKRKNTTYLLIYISFYLACYQAELKKRYVLFPPSLANSISFLTKLKGTLGKAKIKQLLIPRFKAVTWLLKKIHMLIEQSAVFEREISEFGDKANMLKFDSTREQIRSGLKQIKDEGWLSEKEYEVFNQKIV